MSDVTNNDLLAVLLEIKGDVGGLKTSSDLQVKALENHGTRLGVLEIESAGRKGAARVWSRWSTLGAAVAGGLAGSVPTLWRMFRG